MDPFQQYHLQYSGNSGTMSNESANYVVQLNPNSGQYEIVDSINLSQEQIQQLQQQTYTPATTTSSNATTSRNVSSLISENGGNEAVYKIREGDIYYRTADGQELPEIDIDAVVMEDLFGKQGSHQDAHSQQVVYQHQSQNQGHGQQPQYQFTTETDADTHEVAMALSELGVSMQGTLTETYHDHTTQQQQPQQQYYNNQQMQQATLSVAPGSQQGQGVQVQVQGCVAQLVATLMSPDVQVINAGGNLLIHNPNGQTIQIPLPNNGNGGSSSSNQGQSGGQQQGQQILVSSSPQSQQQVIIQPSHQPNQYVCSPQKTVYIQQPQQQSVIVSSASQASYVRELNFDFVPTSETQKEENNEKEDEMDIKIVSCFSKAEASDVSMKMLGLENQSVGEIRLIAPPKDEENEAEQHTDENDKEKRKEVETFMKPLRVNDAGRWVKELRKLEKPKGPKTEKRARIPKWLKSRVDSDDELLQVFKSRFDPKMTHLCGYCYKWFDSGKKLHQHEKRFHIGRKPAHICEICDAKFPARILRLRHQKLHKYDLKYRYSIYERQRNLPSHFRRRFRPAQFSPWYNQHIKKVLSLVSEESFPCFKCGREFPSSEDICDHYDLKHAIQVCGFCEKGAKKFEGQMSLSKHEEEFHGLYNVNKNYEGGAWKLWDLDTFCEERIKPAIILSDIAYFHNYCKKEEKEDGEKKGKAPIYQEYFIERTLPSEEDVEIEEQAFTEGSEVFTVQDANASFAESGSSFQEGDEDKEKIRIQLAYACDQCPKSYDNEHDLKRHAKCHGSPSKANLACQFCGRIFKTHSHKKEHERTHTGEKPYVCPICQRSFIQSSNLKKHIQTHQQSSLQCTTCGKQFIKEASLILHQRAHAQDRKFRCAVCDRAYNYASLLKRHMRIHTGEMPYSCESCGMLFHELVSLHYHRKKVHTGERPHKCDTCGRAFILSSDLKKHVQIHFKPQMDKPGSGTVPGMSPPAKPGIRKRSSSKSFERDELPESPRNEHSSSVTPSPRKVGRIEEEMDYEEENVPLTPSPTSSLENEIISNSKPPIVRVYSRKNQGLGGGEGNEKAEGSGKFVLVSAQGNDQQGQPLTEVENLPPLTPVSTSTSAPMYDEMPRFHQMTTAELENQAAEAAMLLSLSQGHYDVIPQQHQQQTVQVQLHPPTQQELDAATLQKNVEEVLAMGSFSDVNFDMNNIVLVPEAQSEIEIIIDDKNRR